MAIEVRPTRGCIGVLFQSVSGTWGHLLGSSADIVSQFSNGAYWACNSGSPEGILT